MTIKKIDDAILTGIADSIRGKLSVQTQYKPSEMADVIDTIEGGGYPEPTGTKTITANGTGIDVKDYASADVAVPNSYTAEDEGKVVDNGALVAQTSQTVTQNGTYDTTTNDEVVVNVSGGGGSVEVETDVDEYAMDFTPQSNANSAKSGGFSFLSSRKIKVTKLRVWPRDNTASVHISLDGVDVASVLNASVTANQWNDIVLSEPVILEKDTEYLVWYSTPTTALKYKNSSLTPHVDFITFIQSYFARNSAVDTLPTATESGTVYGVDLYIDAYLTERPAVLVSKTITLNGTYEATDDSADGYSEVTVNVSGGGEPTLPSEYQRVEYVETNGSQYVVFQMSLPLRGLIYTRFARMSGTNEQTAFGAHSNSGLSSGTLEIGIASGASSSGVTVWGSGTVYVAYESSTTGNPSSALTFISSALNNNYVSLCRYKTYWLNGRLYDCDIYKLREQHDKDPYELIFSAIPCYRKADDVVGFYDVINSVFYTNAGTGDFVAGPDEN